MRPLVVLAILLLSLNVTARERKNSSLMGDFFHRVQRDGLPSLLEIESSIGKGDRMDVAVAQPSDTANQAPDTEAIEAPSSTPLSADLDPERMPPVSLDDLCNALLTSAQRNELPVPFFANLIWQESRLRDDAVSPVGALGIAQFMPEVAMESGLNNPFDPLQAISASARLLAELRDQFGNLGFVAAAYNAGASRVSEWLKHRRALPRETRDYVIRVTGRTAEDWRKAPPDDAALAFVPHLPCLALPAFAELEESQMQEARLEKPKAQFDKLESRQTQRQSSASMRAARRHAADRKRGHTHDRYVAIQAIAGHGRDDQRQAKRLWHEKRKWARDERSREVRVELHRAARHREAKSQV